MHIVTRWDSDARAAAWEQAQDAAARDPDAAQYLLDCLATDVTDDDDNADSDDDADVDDDELLAAYDATTTQTAALRKPFDPMRLIARVAKFYHWSHRDVMQMPWRSFLGYAREADIMTQEDKARYDDEMRRARGRYGGGYGGGGAGASDADALAQLNSLPRVAR